MKTQPMTGNCARNFEARHHVCFGISPFNSYFSEAKLEDLARWGKQEFDSMHFFVPDVPSAFTLEAMGYDSEKASWKARRQCQYLQNKIHRALKNVGFSEYEACEVYLGWERISGNHHYQQLHNQALQLFEEDESFKKTCLEATQWVLEKKVPDVSSLSEQSISYAVRYLLAELPLFADSAGIVGQSHSVFCYHQRVSFIEKLFQGELAYPVSSNQGFVILE